MCKFCDVCASLCHEGVTVLERVLWYPLVLCFQLGQVVSRVRCMQCSSKKHSNQKASHSWKQNLCFVDSIIQKVIHGCSCRLRPHFFSAHSLSMHHVFYVYICNYRKHSRKHQSAVSSFDVLCKMLNKLQVSWLVGHWKLLYHSPHFFSSRIVRFESTSNNSYACRNHVGNGEAYKWPCILWHQVAHS